MKKLKLALETLRVDSFATIAARTASPGTVAGHELMITVGPQVSAECTMPSGCSGCGTETMPSGCSGCDPVTGDRTIAGA